MSSIQNDPKYFQWLRDLTTLGYSEGITVRAEHADAVEFLYKDGKSPTEALVEYKEFVVRFNAINADSL